MTDLRGFTAKLKNLGGKDLRLKIIVLVGLLGMALILISQFIGKDKQESSKAPENTENTNQSISADEYTAKVEEKLGGLIADIHGVGKVKVMVTLANTGEYVYVLEEKRSTDKNTEPLGESSKTSTKESIQQNYILVDTGYGQKEPLVQKKLEPQIQGVIIVCQGAEDPYVRQRLINVVTTALNLPSNRVCVEKIQNETDQNN